MTDTEATATRNTRTSPIPTHMSTEQIVRADALVAAAAILDVDSPDVTDLHSLAVFILDGTDPWEGLAIPSSPVDDDLVELDPIDAARVGHGPAADAYAAGWDEGRAHGSTVAARCVNDALDRAGYDGVGLRDTVSTSVRAAHVENGVLDPEEVAEEILATPTDSGPYRAAVDDERFRAGLREGIRLAETAVDRAFPRGGAIEARSTRDVVFGNLAALYVGVEENKITTTADLDK